MVAAVSICDIILGSQHIRYTKTRPDTISECIAKLFEISLLSTVERMQITSIQRWVNM